MDTDNKKGSIIKRLTELVFPASCFGCGVDDSWLCPTCQDQVIIDRPAECPYCHKPTKQNRTCPACREMGLLKGVWVIGNYRPAWQSLIHGLKFSFLESMKEDIISLITPALDQFKSCLADDYTVTAVPLARSRFLDRGFNQAELLARPIAKYLDIPYYNLLSRTGRAESQSRLTKEARKDNIVRLKIKCKNVENIPESVIIVDDVYTTGVTMEACAKALKSRGARNIWGIVLARGDWQ
ncbi:MAG: double zinc ribbon domain-containing protein [Patescibacteria group bacterium]